MQSLMNAAAIAKRLGCTSAHVRHLWDAGILPYVDIAATRRRRMRRTDADVVEQYMKNAGRHDAA